MVGPGGTMVQPTQVNSAIQRPGGQGPGGMALEGRYGVSAGNSPAFPLQGQVSLVRMAQGGPVDNRQRGIGSIPVRRLQSGGGASWMDDAAFQDVVMRNDQQANRASRS